MSDCLLAVPSMGSVWVQRQRVKQTAGFYPDCLVTAWTDDLNAGAVFKTAGLAKEDLLSPTELADDYAVGELLTKVHSNMAQFVLHTPADEVARAHERNRLIRWDDVPRVTLEWRPLSKTTRMTLGGSPDLTLATAGNRHAKNRFLAIERALGKTSAAARVDVKRRP